MVIGLLLLEELTMLSEEPLANHNFDITDKKDDYTISDYVSQHFGITIG